jgi:4-hydroxybenzoate polyprenyltransferase
MSGGTINKWFQRLLVAPILILRIPNLLIIILTVWVFASQLVYPELVQHQIIPVMSSKDFYLLLLIVGLIAAGGYLLNDIVDIQTDQVNNKRAFINDGTERRLAWIAYAILAVAPIPFAYSLASEINHTEYMPLYFIVVGTLIVYNLLLKKTPLLGNFCVAVLCAGVVWVMFLAERESLLTLKAIDMNAYLRITQIALFYYVFAFCSNLAREIIKDIQDMEGDQAIGARTLPLVAGIQWSINIIHMSLIGLLVFVIWWLNAMNPSISLITSCLFLVIAPILLIIYRLINNKHPMDMALLSNGFKVWMLMGLLFIFLLTTKL